MDVNGGTTLGEWLERWLEDRRSRIQPATYVNYRGHVRLYLLPGLGGVRLDELTAPLIESFYADLVERGGHNGKPLSPATVRGCHFVLHRALEDCIRLGILRVNVASRAERPVLDPRTGEAPSTDLQVWTAEQLRAFLDFVRDDPLRDLWVVVARTGMRRGEVLGLRWRDVALERNELVVARSLARIDGRLILKRPKTYRMRRLTIDEATVAALERRRTREAEDRAAMDGEWRNDWDLVFTSLDGSALWPDRITRAFVSLVEASGLPRLRLHDVRHTHATLMLQAGVSPKVVSERLGHSNIGVTLNVYSHVLPAMDAEAVERFAAHLDDSDGSR